MTATTSQSVPGTLFRWNWILCLPGFVSLASSGTIFLLNARGFTVGVNGSILVQKLSFYILVATVYVGYCSVLTTLGAIGCCLALLMKRSALPQTKRLAFLITAWAVIATVALLWMLARMVPYP